MRNPDTTAITRLLRRAVDVKPNEVQALLLSAAYFFFVLSSYYVLRPIRDEMAVASGVRNLPWMFTVTLIAMLLVHPPYAALVSKLPRTRFISYTYRFFMANLMVFFALLTWAPESWNIGIGWAFFSWVSVFNLFIVSVFWAFMADVFNSDQGKRLFGFIAVGGTVGAIVGSATTAMLAVAIGPVQLILISVVLIEIAVQVVRRLATVAHPTDRSVPEESGPRVGGLPEPEPGRGYSAHRRDDEEPIGGSVWSGVTAVFRSPYLLGICAYMLLYTIMATFLYFQQTEIVGQYMDDRAVRTAFFAKIDLAVNALTLTTQVFFTGRILKRLGVALTLTILPVICIIGFTGLGFWPLLGVLVAFQVARRAGNYAVARPTREVLYTVVSRDEKYKAKNLIDTFVYRGGDQVGAWAYGVMMFLGLGMSAIAFIAVPICAVWAAVGFLLGGKQARRAREQVRSDLAVEVAPGATS